jgi:hypothetical protein
MSLEKMARHRIYITANCVWEENESLYVSALDPQAFPPTCWDLGSSPGQPTLQHVLVATNTLPLSPDPHRPAPSPTGPADSDPTLHHHAPAQVCCAPPLLASAVAPPTAVATTPAPAAAVAPLPAAATAPSIPVVMTPAAPVPASPSLASNNSSQGEIKIHMNSSHKPTWGPQEKGGQ